MKKLFIVSFVVIAMSLSMMFTPVQAQDSSSVIKKAISEYKEGNYLGCISDLKMVLEYDSDNAVAWYYLGNAYMKIAMKAEAHEAFDNVVFLNTVPKLTSYSIQAKMCMENGTHCDYKDFTADQISKLRDNPAEFMKEYIDSLNTVVEKSEDVVEIEKLIQGSYGNNVHPDAQNFIMQQRTQIRQTEINNPNKAELPTDEKVAEALMLLKKQNMDSLYMMFDNDKKNETSTYIDLMQSFQGENKKMTPEMIQLSMMSNMMPTF